MSTGRGDKAAYSDVKNWYDTFNNLASNYSNGIGTLAVPSAGARINASDINNLHSKINSFRSDAYLGTQAGWWPTGTNVSAGAQITNGSLSSILTTVSNASRVKCRNTATNSKGAQSNGTRNNGACEWGTWENVDKSCGGHGYGRKSNGRRSSGYHWNGDRGNGVWGNVSQSNGANGDGTNSHGNHSSGTVIDITCAQGTKTN